MRMNLVKDERMIREFYHKVIHNSGFLAGKQTTNVGIVFLASRKKYFDPKLQPYISSSEFLQRQIIKFNSEREFIKVLKRLDAPEGSYTIKLKLPNGRPLSDLQQLPNNVREIVKEYNPEKVKCDSGECYIIDVPKSSMVLYVSLGLHNTVNATLNMINDINKSIRELLNIDSEIDYVFPDVDKISQKRQNVLKKFNKTHVIFFSELHKSGKYTYIVIDIDEKNVEYLRNIINIIRINTNSKPQFVSETRNGFHIIYEKHSLLMEFLHRDFRQYLISNNIPLDKVEVKKKPMTPVPGTLQGGFLVRKIEI